MLDNDNNNILLYSTALTLHGEGLLATCASSQYCTT